MPQFNKPFASTSPNDHRASIWVVTLLCLTFVALGVATRTYTRFKAFGSDDYVILGAFVVGLAEFCTVIGGLEVGLGKSIDNLSPRNVALAGQIFLASEALFIITIYVVKHSVLCTVERLLAPDQKREQFACWVVQGVLALCAVASLLLVTVSCSAGSLLTQSNNQSCPQQTSRWIAIAVIDGVTEISVFLAFCIFISSLQLQTRLKVTVALLLAFRLGCIAFSAVHAKHIASFAHTPIAQNTGLAVVGSVVWQQLNMGYSLLSALLIALKSFLASFDVSAGWGENGTFKASSLSVSGNNRSGGVANASYNLKPLSKGSRNASVMRSWASRNDDTEDQIGRRKADKTGYMANVEAGKEGRDDGSVGSGRSGISQHPIIRYEQRYEVTHEDQSVPRVQS